MTIAAMLAAVSVLTVEDWIMLPMTTAYVPARRLCLIAGVALYTVALIPAFGDLEDSLPRAAKARLARMTIGFAFYLAPSLMSWLLRLPVESWIGDLALTLLLCTGATIAACWSPPLAWIVPVSAGIAVVTADSGTTHPVSDALQRVPFPTWVALATSACLTFAVRLRR